MRHGLSNPRPLAGGVRGGGPKLGPWVYILKQITKLYPPLPSPPREGEGTSLFFPHLLSLFLIILLTACGSSAPSGKPVSFHGLPKTQPDPAAVRSIVLLHPHSGERVEGVYFHDNHYDSRMMDKINHLFRDRHADEVSAIDPELIDYLVDIRTRLGLPPTVTFEILSGYRTRETNERLAFSNGNVAKESLHMHGWAVDFRIPYVDGKVICEIAKTMQRGGVAYYPKDNHVHVDLGNIRTWREK